MGGPRQPDRPETGALAAIRVIGIGRLERGDDAVGRIVARNIRRDGLEGVWVTECAGEFSALMDLWDGADAAVVVDALQSGAAPGTLFRIDALRERLPVPASASTHGFGLAEAVEIGRTLGRLPPVLIVHGVEGARFGPGESLSPAVAAAVPPLGDAVRREALALAGTRPEHSR
jgi:hydrogenase maturation protease